MLKRTIEEGVLNNRQLTERALISAIGSLGNGGIVAMFGVFYYPRLPLLGKRVRSLCAFATICVVAGLAAAVTSTNVRSFKKISVTYLLTRSQIWTLLACQGFLVGLGGGILMYILGPILPEYFPDHSGLAQGCMYACKLFRSIYTWLVLTVTAAALGGLVWSFGLTTSLETLGVRKTLGILSGCCGVTLSAASALALPPRKFDKRDTRILSWRAFGDPLFFCLAVVNLTHPLTVAIPFTFGPEFAESLGIKITTATELLAINSGVGIPARLVTGLLADSLGHQNILVLATAVYALAIWSLWLPSALVNNFGLYVALSVCHGLINGVFSTVSNSVQRQLFGDEMNYPKSGALITIRGIGYVVGVPVAGALVTNVTDKDLRGKDFVRAIVYTGSLLIVSMTCLLTVRWIDAKRNGWKWTR